MSTNKKEWKKPILTNIDINIDTEFAPSGTGADGFGFADPPS